MSKRHEEEEHEGNSERWMLTYSDMITLLLALFAMLYAMSNVDAQKFQAISEQFGIAFGSGKSIIQGVNTSGNTAGGLSEMISKGELPSVEPSSSASKSADLVQESIEGKLKNLIQSNGLGTVASVRSEERGVVVSFLDALLFPSGSARVNDDAKNVLIKLSEIANSVDNFIRVEGSTDNVPISNGQFGSNWELAFQRATNVVYLLLANGVDPKRISATSFGEFRPVAANDTEENKQQNRRVDIVFVNKIYNINESGYKPNDTGKTQ